MTVQASNPGRPHGHHLCHTCPVEQTGTDHDITDNRQGRLQAKHPRGRVDEGVFLVVTSVRRMVRRHHVDRAVCQGRSEHLDVLGGTANLSVECYDSASPSALVEPDKIVVDPVTYNVSIYFASAQTGSCNITGSGGVTSSGASGAGMASQLGDLGLVLTSPTVVTAGLNCSNATPCNTRLGTTVYSVTNSSTITLSAGSGTLYLYVDSSGALAAGHNLTLTCAG